MDLYIFLNLAVAAIPVVLSFDKKVAFYRRWPAVFISAAVVGIVYLLWDAAATARGDWGFNEAYTGVFRIAGLPIGEILFFICVPFSCLFIFEVAGAYFADRMIRIPRHVIFLFIGAALTVAYLFRDKQYTLWVFISVAGFLAAAAWTGLLGRRQFWIYMGISMAAFFGMNSILTGLPVVTYNPEAIFGFRIITIPLEDFFYNFSLLGFNALAFTLIKEKVGRRG
jgi:lycopene cyclase domain-containing protein